MWKSILYAVAAVVAAGAAFLGSGFLMPREHEAQTERLIQAPPARVWALVSGMDGMTSWLSGTASVVRMPDENGHAMWKVADRSGGTLVYVTRREEAPTTVVREVRDPAGNFGGTWTITLAPEGGATRVSIVENGWIAAAPFRPVQRFIIGYDSAMNTYLDDLSRAAGSRG